MKCPALACLWSPSPPSHCITSVAVVGHNPAYIFTGGSDGAIVLWKIVGGDVRPLALLCGHAVEIVDFASCFPDAIDPEPSNTNPVMHCPEVLSASADGVVCVWSTSSFRCRRRRKLPPWAGNPSHLAAVPSFPRHVCFVCKSGESSKSSVLIVDSGTLLVVQTVFHGSLGIELVKSMQIMVDETEKGDYGVFLVDGSGKVQLLALSKDSGDDGEGSSSVNGGFSSDSLTSGSGESLSSESMKASVVAQKGTLLALVYESRCEFRNISSGMVLGEISLRSIELGSGDSSKNLTLLGGMFLYNGLSGGVSEIHVSDEHSPKRFVLWYSDGSAVVFNISMSDGAFDTQLVCEVPSEPLASGGRQLFCFVQLNDSLVRLESVSISVGGLLAWKPNISVWSMSKLQSVRENEHGNFCSCLLLGKGSFSGFQPYHHNEELDGEFNCSFRQRSAPVDVLNDGNTDGILVSLERFISSSMVLSEDFYSPHAVVYGFYNGEIEVVSFLNQSLDANSTVTNLVNHANLHAIECSFSGHTGAILCLAAHYMPTSASSSNFQRILVSGSIDCTVRLWDLDSKRPLLVMHHHIAPVKQIIMPPALTDRPWKDCFLSVGEDGCVALVSFETLHVERMFPGHPGCPAVVAWDNKRGYLACLCRSMSKPSDSVSVLWLWDMKSGALERIIRGSASHSMLEHFCSGISINVISGSILGGTTSASTLLVPLSYDSGSFRLGTTSSDVERNEVPKGKMVQPNRRGMDFPELCNYLTKSNDGKLPYGHSAYDANSGLTRNNSAGLISSHQFSKSKKHPIICSCPFPGIASLEFELSSLASLSHAQSVNENYVSHDINRAMEHALQGESSKASIVTEMDRSHAVKDTIEGYLLRFSLCFLHLWDIDLELDKQLKEEMNVSKPNSFQIAAGILGDRGSMTLMFPGLFATLELWKSSSEYCAMRSLTIVSLAQCVIGLYRSTTIASSVLAAFYTRNFAEKVPEIKPPLLQLLVSFWQDPSEHVRMAARSVFHCAAPRSIPHPLYGRKTFCSGATPSPVNGKDEHIHSENDQISGSGYTVCEITIQTSSITDHEIVSWLESFEIHEWVSCIGGTRQDAMASQIIVAAALVVWYPSKVKDNLASLVVERLVKLVMSMNNKFSSTAAELLAEGMENTWKFCLGSQIPSLVGDIYFQIECLAVTPAKNAKDDPSMTTNILESLVGILLPSLAMADITGFLKVIEDQIWSTSSDSPVHLISLKTLFRIVRGSPKPLALHLDKVVNYVIQTMDPGNLVMRKACLKISLIVLKEISRILPMVAMNESSTRLAVGDAIGDICCATIHVYDIESVSKIKILDASGPLGLPHLIEGVSNSKMATAISALSFSPDGE
ncbi:hypothetical protein HPP92_021303, partial [Vanilla planifolia]